MKKVVMKREVEEKEEKEKMLKQHLIVCALKKRRIKEMYTQWKWLYCSAPYPLYDNIITAIAIVRHRCYTPLLVRQ